ncbi:MAG: bifunctional enoyl-CoA hydratase/phosphate acetyltransferase [Firmicutes bacterium]|nr:bifunctional enoyl-CoA hydratase/phosphate acetyltransferase [Bacillota bacterium]
MFEKAANRGKSIVSVAACADLHVLEACVHAFEKGLAGFILVGDKIKTQKIAGEAGLNISGFEMIDEPDDLLACKKAVALVADGTATALMKGLIDTSVIMRAALDRETGIRTNRKLSHIAAFELPTYHKLLFLTDAAINIAPTIEDKTQIIENAVEALNNMGIVAPKTALLAAKEKVDEKMPATLEWAEIVKMQLPNCITDGPLALDNAISKEACEIKGIDSPVGGDADLLVAPDIEAGNVLYKALAFLANARCGGVVLGAKRPIVLTSRADSADSKLISIALSVLF